MWMAELNAQVSEQLLQYSLMLSHLLSLSLSRSLSLEDSDRDVDLVEADTKKQAKKAQSIKIQMRGGLNESTVMTTDKERRRPQSQANGKKERIAGKLGQVSSGQNKKKVNTFISIKAFAFSLNTQS